MEKETKTVSAAPQQPLDRSELRSLIDERAVARIEDRVFTYPAAGGAIRVATTIDPDLQNFLEESLDRTNSRYVGIVVMEADSGRILALTGFDRTDPARNPCLRSDFPAASIFKIVTAAGAIDRFGLNADSPVRYSGAKHTLYRKQLVERMDRYTTTIPLREAFADSINPVFGKIGTLKLGKPLLEATAEAFGFNRPLDFDLLLPPSRFAVSDEPYNMAEVASGFNRDTTISPLHGAVMASAVLNDGQMVAPILIESVSDTADTLLYRAENAPRRTPVMSPRAARELQSMMETTVSSGTARKIFRNQHRDAVLSRLDIGGKTGSIDNATHEVRFDWFVGFARAAQKKDLVIAAVVGHEKFIGTRAGEYARMAMSRYYANPVSPLSKAVVASDRRPPQS